MADNPKLADMGTQKISVSEQTNSLQFTNFKSDSFVVDMERLSHLTDKDVTANSRFTRNLSRKLSQQRGSEKKINPSIGNENDNGVVSTSSPRESSKYGYLLNSGLPRLKSPWWLQWGLVTDQPKTPHLPSSDHYHDRKHRCHHYLKAEAAARDSVSGALLTPGPLILGGSFSCLPPYFGLTLERSDWRSSVKFVHPALYTVLQSARAGYWTLERGLVSHARAGIECPIERDFHTSSTFTVACSPLERIYSRSSGDPCLHVRSSRYRQARA
ncbi:hypothetical protein HYC85_025244 [Camellia sinensis]|uniref:Uncharacterized protein n=1 Tax=Camellia sinensis TaxID=4442 RepID=A0A7J7GE76_CAMSI|nr:hypothetical protein HYC85_025244 [Camellia sinensis]